jgi:hypothetical protein
MRHKSQQSKRSIVARIPFLTAAMLSMPTRGHAQPSYSPKAYNSGGPSVASALCIDGECQPAITKLTFFSRPAYCITDGRTEAIIVPQIGRIMSYGRVGGPNLLWNAPTPQGIDWGWKNYGGDKNWLAPQSDWPVSQGKGWPPDPAFDGQPHEVEILSGGKVRLTSPLSESSGMRFVRTIYFADNGEMVIEQTAIKEKGAAIRAAIWNITQTAPGQAVFLPLSTESAYKKGYLQLQGKESPENFEAVKPNLLRVTPTKEGGGAKIGVDAPVSGIASVSDGVAFVQRAAKPAGKYPDGTNAAGLPVEFYIYSNPKLFYYEMELLGPLKNFSPGGKSTHTLRWSLHDLPSKDVTSPAVADAVEKLLNSEMM